MKKHATRDPICRSFRQDFPQFVDRAKALGVRISLSPGPRRGNPRAFWMDGDWQMTGYLTKKDGSPFTDADASENIDRLLRQVEEDRKAISSMTVAERFARVMADMRQIEPQYRMIGGVRLPCGDRGHCFFMADYDGEVRLHGVGVVARGKAKWMQGETYAEQMARFCDELEADFAYRQKVEAMDGAA